MLVTRLIVPFEGQLVYGFADVVRGLGRKYELQVTVHVAPKELIVDIIAAGDDDTRFGRAVELFERELPEALRHSRIAPPERNTYNNYGQAGAMGPQAAPSRNIFDSVQARAHRLPGPRMGAASRAIMQYLAREYERGGFGNHKTWTFSPAPADTNFPELTALGLIKSTGLRGSPFVLTDAGHRWVMANRPGARAERKRQTGSRSK
jgi:hypothetical protein